MYICREKEIEIIIRMSFLLLMSCICVERNINKFGCFFFAFVFSNFLLRRKRKKRDSITTLYMFVCIPNSLGFLLLTLTISRRLPPASIGSIIAVATRRCCNQGILIQMRLNVHTTNGAVFIGH